MMEEALHFPFLQSLDGERGHRKRLFTNESEIMDLVNEFGDFNNILLNDLFDGEDEGSEDGLSWNELEDFASGLLDGSNGDEWDFISDPSMKVVDTALSGMAADAWLPINNNDSPCFNGSILASENQSTVDNSADTVKSSLFKPKFTTYSSAATDSKVKTVLSRKSQVKPTAGNICPAIHTPKIVTSAELKIMGTRNNKFRHMNSSKFQIDEPKLTIIEKGVKSAVVLKKMMVKRGHSLLRLPIKNAVNHTQLKLQSPITQKSNVVFDEGVQPVFKGQLTDLNEMTKHKSIKVVKSSMKRQNLSKPFIGVDHDYCSGHPDEPFHEMMELMDSEGIQLQEEIVLGADGGEIHSRSPENCAIPSVAKMVCTTSVADAASSKKKMMSTLFNDKSPQRNAIPSKLNCEDNNGSEKKIRGQNGSQINEKRSKTMFIPPKYQQVSYCEKILQIKNDSEDELVDIEGVDESDAFDRLPSYVTTSKAVSPRKSRENKYIDKDEDYTPRKERQRGRKKKDRIQSTSPAKMKRKHEAIEQGREDKQKKRGRPAKRIEPETKKVKEMNKPRVNAKPSLSSSDNDEPGENAKHPSAFEAVYTRDSKFDYKIKKEEEPDEVLPCEGDNFQLYNDPVVKEMESTDEFKSCSSDTDRVRSLSWSSSHSYGEIDSTYQNDLGFTIFGNIKDEADPRGMNIETLPEIPDSFPMEDVKIEIPVHGSPEMAEMTVKEELVSDENHNVENIMDENAVEFEIEIMGEDGSCVRVNLDRILGEPSDEEKEEESDEEENLQPIKLRFFPQPQNPSLDEETDSSSQSPKKQKRKLTLSDYLTRKEYEKDICSSNSRQGLPSVEDVEEGEIKETTDMNLEETMEHLKLRIRNRTESEESDFYKKIKHHKGKRNESASNSSSSDSCNSDSSCDSDSLRSRSPSPFLKSRRQSRTRLRYSSGSRSRRRGSYSTDSTSSDSSSHSRSRSRESLSSEARQRRRRTSYNSVSSRNRNTYDVKSKSRRKRQTSLDDSDERKVIYLSDFTPNITERDIHRKFAKFGPISDIKIKFRSTGEPYAFVTFYDGEDALDAIEHGNDDKSKPQCGISFGGRRRYCRENYADLDNQSEARYPQKTLDFDALLRETKEKLTKRC